MEFGPTNWQKACFVPTKSDGVLIGYRRWLNKYSQGQVDWGSKFNGEALPPTPPREELLDRCVYYRARQQDKSNLMLKL